MNYKKIIKKIRFLEKQYKILKEELSSHPILSSKNFEYTAEDKTSFLHLWKRYTHFYKQIRKTIIYTNYGYFLLFFDINAFVLKRHLIIFYYNSLVDTLDVLGKHETYIRQLVQDNYFLDFGNIAKYVYRPSHIQIINSPSILISSLERYLNSEVKGLIETGLIQIKPTEKRFFTDYGNAYYYIRKKIYNQIFKISKFVGTRMKKIKFSKRKNGLIKEEYFKEYLQIAKPGDILLTRINWKATNISIPGFWKHMALYLGTGEFLINNFKKETKQLSLENNKHYIIESTGEGVCIKEIFHLAKQSDYLGVSRTTFSEEKVMRSIKTALSMQGRGYDYIFNFYSDKHLVCSELVLKSFAKQFKEDRGIELKLEQIAIGVTFPPNNFIKLLNQEKRKKNPLLIPLFFIDSKEQTGQSFISTEEEFLKTGNRPVSSFFLK